MKLAVLADIHGNLPALEAVLSDLHAWEAETVVLIGDVINRGPSSIPCLDRVLAEAETSTWHFVRGNHEDYVLECGDARYPENSARARVFAGAHWIHEQLGERRRGVIAAWPERLDLRIGETVLAFTHASVLGIADGIFPWTEGREFERRRDPEVDVFCVAHTHLPFVRAAGTSQVVNCGAVGLPFDGDRRACYARLDDQDGHWQVEIRRLEYDFEQARRDFHERGYLDRAGPLASLILEELENAESHLFPWTQAYFQRVESGELSLGDAVNRYLDRIRAENPPGA